MATTKKTTSEDTHYIEYDQPREGRRKIAKALCHRRVEARLDSENPTCPECKNALRILYGTDDD